MRMQLLYGGKEVAGAVIGIREAVHQQQRQQAGSLHVLRTSLTASSFIEEQRKSCSYTRKLLCAS